MVVYFRTVTEDDVGRVTHSGQITTIVTHPEDHPDRSRELREHLPEGDTYLDHNDPPSTLYLVTDIATLEDPFSQTELQKRDGIPVDQNYRRGCAIVKKHSGH